jgi:hypothetical protein
LSFLDEREDRPPRPRRPPPRGPDADRQTLALRRAIALGVGLLMAVLVVLLIRSCLNAREERAYEDYVQEVASLVTESDQQSEALFDLLGGTGEQSSVDVQNNVNGFRVEAERLVDRAQATEHPDDLQGAQDFLVETLQFRSDGLTAVAEQLRTALGDEGRGEAVAQIAAQMQNFLASDVIYSQRVIPRLEGALREKELLGEVGDIPRSTFLPDIAWLEPEVVGARIAALRGAGDDTAAAPGLHGTELGEVTVQPSGQALAEGGTTPIELTGDAAFEVQVTNQGENDETDIPVTISISGGASPIELEGTIDSVAAGETATATIPLEEEPPTGQQVEITVTVEEVPGEETVDNNEATFGATFSG